MIRDLLYFSKYSPVLAPVFRAVGTVFALSLSLSLSHNTHLHLFLISGILFSLILIFPLFPTGNFSGSVPGLKTPSVGR
jgi:hypothetical protein